MIEDLELRELFKAESDEHLTKLDNGLLHLEKHPDDTSELSELFREAHSLKGAARMLGVADVETLAHHFEDVLGAASRGDHTFTPELIDRLINGLDEVRKLVDEAVSGTPANVSVVDALARLKGEAPPLSPHSAPSEQQPETAPAATLQPEPAPLPSPPFEPETAHTSQPAVSSDATTPVPTSIENAIPTTPHEPKPEISSEPEKERATSSSATPPDQKPPSALERETTAPSPKNHISEPMQSVQEQPASQKPAPKEESGSDSHKVGTIRVKPRQLDQLMNHAAELTVVRTRLKRRLTEIESLVSCWDELQRVLAEQSIHQEVSEHGADGEADLWRSPMDRLGSSMRTLRASLFEDEASMDIVARELEEGIRNLRLLPLSTLFNLFPRLVRDLSRQLVKSGGVEKRAELIVEGGETTADKQIIEEMKDPLMHLIRNSMDHGLEFPDTREALGKNPVGTVTLRASRTSTHVIIEVGDDGRGLNLDDIRKTAIKRRLYTEKELATWTSGQVRNLIFTPGFSTSPLVTDLSGRGVGLDAVRTNVENLKGTISVDSTPDAGSLFTIRLPITLATTPVFIVRIDDQQFAIPIDYIQNVRRVLPADLFTLEGHSTITINDEPISVADLSDLLELPQNPSKSEEERWKQARPCIILVAGGDRIGIFVDDLVDELEVVLKPHGSILRRVRNVSGSTILGSGEVCTVLNPQDLIRSIQNRHISASSVMTPAHEVGTNGPTSPIEDDGSIQERRTILLVEDSITTRTQEKRILEAAGYDVITAVDGLDALQKMGSLELDAVVSDIQMPNLDGLSLCERIRQNSTYEELPIILVTSLSTEDDKRRGMEAGANAYISKTSFEQKGLLDTLRRLV
ncbi:MAG: hybrid sensor histidine kinase/response regulator [Magnetococcales bacterium]|nr:hybrid sensor histidine kinase/response regulator [Magnetococcales bacterium]